MWWTDPCFVSSQIEIGRTGACNVHYSLPDLQAETLSPYHPPLSQPLCFHTPSPYHQPRCIVSSTVSSVTFNEKCRRFIVQLKRKEINKLTIVLCGVLICWITVKCWVTITVSTKILVVAMNTDTKKCVCSVNMKNKN